MTPVADTSATRPPRRLLRGSERLTGLVGSRLLVGVTLVDPDGGLIGREQFCGVVQEVGDGVVVVARGDGSPAVIPADEDAFRSAPAGSYTLAGSGEVVLDPDVLTTWTVVVHP